MSKTPRPIPFGIMLQGPGSHMHAWKHPSNPADASVNLDFFFGRPESTRRGRFLRRLASFRACGRSSPTPRWSSFC